MVKKTGTALQEIGVLYNINISTCYMAKDSLYVQTF